MENQLELDLIQLNSTHIGGAKSGPMECSKGYMHLFNLTLKCYNLVHCYFFIPDNSTAAIDILLQTLSELWSAVTQIH